MNDLEMIRHMVRDQIEARGIHEKKVLFALSHVKRERFVPETDRCKAYEDHPLAIGWKQTISQPYIVAFMTERLEIKPADKILEIGTGSGYQTAILAELAEKVYTVEIIPELLQNAVKTLSDLGYSNIYAREGNGREGWREFAPFDKIMVTAAAEDGIPPELICQLREGGRMISPVGRNIQSLVLGEKVKGHMSLENVLSVSFVPLI